MKRSTASVTATKKNNRWLRLGTRHSGFAEINQLLDFYWGGPERRLTGLTLRIIGVNAIALLILVFGMVYLSQYQSTLIEARLETFKTDAELVATAIAHEEVGPESNIHSMTNRFGKIMGQRIRVFNTDGQLVTDSEGYTPTSLPERRMTSIQTLQNMAQWIIDIMPERRVLPLYPEPANAMDGGQYADVPVALNGQASLSAWHNNAGKVFLSAAMPILHDGKLTGVVLLTRQGHDIEEALGSFWLDILKIFSFTLIITILLSLYLSGVIADPLRKLARAAENVRTGKAKPSDIPDLSNRHDEIGDLSVVLREMTMALGERMDSIESFAADVAHELKNPLTSLRSAIETASIVKKQEDKDKLFAIIVHDLERLDRLISDISNASRIEAELSREAFAPIDLCKALSQLLDIYQNPLERARGKNKGPVRTGNLALKLECAGDVFTLGVEGRLMQVFDNLLSNALTFSPDNGTVTIRVVPQRQRIAIHVEDHGPGIPAGKLETIFDRFYSERPDHEDYGQHSGLGLSICKQIVEAHNGLIFAENMRNDEGKVAGARFTVMLQPITEGS